MLPSYVPDMETTSPSSLAHGGDLAAAEALFGKPDSGWLDLSTGVNATAYPDTRVSAQNWQHLPQEDATAALLAAARRYYRVPDGIGIIGAAGSQALLQSLPEIASGGRVAIVGPTYAEHERVWRDRGYEIRNVSEVAAAGSADIAVVVNPNNPDGRIVPPRELLAHASALSAWRGILVVDEAFADVAPEASILPHLTPSHPVLVLRSFGKFFGLAGLRLGFAAGTAELMERLAGRLGPWAVSGPALEIGARALSDGNWVTSMRAHLTQRRIALDEVLKGAGLHIAGGTDLFQLIDDMRAPDVFQRLGRAGIFTRPFSHNPRWLRLGVPGSDADLRRLAATLAAPDDSS